VEVIGAQDAGERQRVDGFDRDLPVAAEQLLDLGGGCSYQSISPVWSAAAAVAASTMMCHSTRSKCTRFGPAVRLGVPAGVGL
jgi:hypothetical protein